MSKVALITGTSTGVGLDLSVALAQKGYKTYASMRNLESKDRLLASAKQHEVDISLLKLDVQNDTEVNTAIDTIINNEGRIDVLVNSAGAGFIKTTENATVEEAQWVMDVNFLGVVRCTKAVLPHMRSKRAGHIVNISSVGGLVGQPFNEFYCAAKFAVEGYTESLATYVQPEFGINFTAIEPGGIASEFANNVLSQLTNTGGLPDDEYKPLLDRYIAKARANSIDEDSGVYQTSRQVADIIVECIQLEKPPIRLRTSEWSENLCRFKTSGDPTGKLQQSFIFENYMKV